MNNLKEHINIVTGGTVEPGHEPEWMGHNLREWEKTPKHTEDLALFDDMSRNPPLGEEAPLILWDDKNTSFWRSVQNPNFIIQTEETAKGLAILDEMRLRDTDISTPLVDRALVIASLDHDVIAADPENAASRDMADLFKSDLEEIDLEALIKSFTYDLFYGFGVRQIPWKFHNSHWAFDDLEPIPQWAWTFQKDTFLPRIIPFGQDSSFEGIEVSHGRFLYTLNRDPVNGKNPYGYADGLDVYYPTRYKNWTIRAMLQAAAKIGGIIAWGTYADGASEKQKEELLNTVRAVMNNQAGVKPESQTIEIPDYGRMSVKDFFEAITEMFSRMIRRRLTGAEAGAGRGTSSTGTLAESQTHKEVGDEWKEGAAKFVMNSMDKFARLWTDFNFGTEIPAPKFTLDFEGREDQLTLAQTADIWSTIMPLQTEELYQKSGWTPPGPTDETTGVRSREGQFTGFGNVAMLPPEQQQAIIAGVSPEAQQQPPMLPARAGNQDTPEFGEGHPHEGGCDHGHMKAIGELDAATFEELKTIAAKWDTQQRNLTELILDDAAGNPNSYPAFMAELKNDLNGEGIIDYDSARKTFGIPKAARSAFQQFVKGAQASMFTLGAVQQFGKISDDTAANFAEHPEDPNLIYIMKTIRGIEMAAFAQFQEEAAEQIESFPFEQALAILRGAVPTLSPEFYNDMGNKLDKWAFTVSGLESEATVKAVLDSLIKAEENGIPFEQWRNEMDEILDSGDIEKLKPGQLETVFTTNLLQAYNAASENLVNEVDPTGELYPAFQFFNGNPVSQICIARNEKIFPRSDSANIPPLHFRCKSFVVWLSKFETFKAASEQTREALPPIAKGFNISPAKQLSAGLT